MGLPPCHFYVNDYMPSPLWCGERRPPVPDSEATAVASGALAGMRIVVTGAAQGIGASTLRAYVAAGADVAALDVNAGDGAAAAAAADAAGPGTAWFLRCDVGNR